jgi:hypothetical protein
MNIETLEEFKIRIAPLSKDEVRTIRDGLFEMYMVAFKMRKIVGPQVYKDMWAKYLACVDLTT